MNGYEVASTTATNEKSNVNSLRKNITKQNAITLSETKIRIASKGVTVPATIGRDLVRSTLPSISRSAKSFIAQPAERIRMTPSTNTMSTTISGEPSLASNMAHNVGHNNRKMPIGLCKRISCEYATNFCFIGIKVKCDLAAW